MSRTRGPVSRRAILVALALLSFSLGSATAWPPPISIPLAGGSGGTVIHGPIDIRSDAQLCGDPQSGVVNCATADGSPANPFRISGWQIATGARPAIRLEGVTQAVSVEGNVLEALPAGNAPPLLHAQGLPTLYVLDNAFETATFSDGAILLSDVVRGRVEGNAIEGPFRSGIDATGSTDLRIVGNAVKDLAGTAFRLAGSSVIADSNTVFATPVAYGVSGVDLQSTSDQFDRVLGGVIGVASRIVMTASSMSDNFPCSYNDCRVGSSTQGGAPSRGAGVRLADSLLTLVDVSITDFEVNVETYDSVAVLDGVTLTGGDVGLHVVQPLVGTWIHGSTVAGNREWGALVEGGSLDAAQVWWGAVDGPAGAGGGHGDAVSEGVDFVPYLLAPPP